MIQFVNPIWLAASAAIVVPVILHMWNDRRGKVLRIGSVAMLTGGAQRMAWRRRVTQWLLLLVRCLLLLALAVLLARPVIRKEAGSKGWVLTVESGGWIADSLVKAGWERHVFPDSDNYWEGFRAEDRMAPVEVPFYIRTPGLARRFGGERPVTAREVRWEVELPGDSVSRWTQAAWAVSRDSIRVVEGLSRATATAYSAKTVGLMARPDSVVVDTSVLRVAIFADAAYRQDGRYLKAAVMALRDFSRRRIEIIEGFGVVGDWLFWLSDRPLPDVRGYRQVFQYISGKERTVHTWVAGMEWMKEIGAAAPDSESDSAELMWRDGFGRGVLTRGGSIYRFYGRLNPDWNGLVWSSDFPVLLEKLLFERPAFADGSAGGKDRRMLDPQQIVPLRGDKVDHPYAGLRAMLGEAGGKSRGAPSPDGQAETELFWIVLFLFILERILVNAKQTT